ncbi:hypothetical protein B0A49_08600 [Cryomyces minteri]|uniref:Uncharacterized protein n=1 Tax=Cryomyces minteri TaxID=331657 RepID=A0A4U0WUJ7_9PEZI|nr:hypothetical protein B0A49_08600 [Cryomyces minteri]
MANMQPALPPQPIIYIDENQQEIFQALQHGILPEVRDAISQIEHRMAPGNPASSRLTRKLPMEPTRILASALLACVDRRVLEALLDGTLLRKLKLNPRWRGLAQKIFHDPNDTINDPGCYVNLLARHDGSGLMPDEFEEALFAMEVCVLLETDTTNMLVRRNVSVEAGVNRAYNQTRKASYKTFLTQKMITFLSDQVRQFTTINRKKLASASITEIPFPAEVGWTMHLSDRLKAHKTMGDNSVDLFVLANCVLQHLFSAKITMFQLVIFRPFEEDLAAVGESMLSHLAASYQSYGGFNATQGGLSVTKLWKTYVGEWSDIKYALMRGGVFDLAQRRLEQDTQSLRDQLKEIDLVAAIVKAEADLADKQSKTRENERTLDQVNRSVADESIDVRNALEKVERRARRRRELEEVEKLQNEGLELLEATVQLEKDGIASLRIVVRKETAEHSRAKFSAIYEIERIEQKIESLREQQKQELDIIRAGGRRVPSEADKKHDHDEALSVKKEAELKAMRQAKEFAQRTAQEASERHKALLEQREQELTKACKTTGAMSKELQKLKGKAAAV